MISFIRNRVCLDSVKEPDGVILIVVCNGDGHSALTHNKLVVHQSSAGDLSS